MKKCVSALVLASLPSSVFAGTSELKTQGHVIELIEYSGDSARTIATYDLTDSMARIRCVVAKEIIARASEKTSRFTCGLVL